MKVNWIISDQSITVNYNGETHVVSKDEAHAPNLIKALKEKKYDEIPLLISAAKRIETMSHGLFSVKDGEIVVDGVTVPNFLGRKIEEFYKEGLPYEPLVKFAKNLQLNPSFRVTQHLYEFLEKNNHPITENGCFIAYKKVRPDFKDIYSGKFDNSPGNIVEMARNKVNEDPEQTCSYGLHVSAYSYCSQHYGTSSDVILEVEVHPSDVVAIPRDYNASKMRVCKYKVLGTVDAELCTPLRVTATEESEEEYCENCSLPVDEEGAYLCNYCQDEEDADENSSEEEASEEEAY